MGFRTKLSNGVRTTEDRVKKTRLYLMETGKWAAGDASGLMDLLSTGLRTGASSISARNAAVDITHALEDYASSDYKCFVLDSVATACDIAAFIPGNTTKKLFGLTVSASCFCRTFCNKCKNTNAFGCN